jgi:quercetin dioxygenase-like cupin family protein
MCDPRESEDLMIVKTAPGGFKDLIEGVTVKNLVHGEKTHLTKMKLEKGALVPEHQHPQEQTGYLISGSLRFFSGDEETIVSPGDCWTFAGGESHGAEALEDTVVLELFSPVREEYLNL